MRIILTLIAAVAGLLSLPDTADARFVRRANVVVNVNRGNFHHGFNNFRFNSFGGYGVSSFYGASFVSPFYAAPIVAPIVYSQPLIYGAAPVIAAPYQYGAAPVVAPQVAPQQAPAPVINNIVLPPAQK